MQGVRQVRHPRFLARAKTALKGGEEQVRKGIGGLGCRRQTRDSLDHATFASGVSCGNGRRPTYLRVGRRRGRKGRRAAEREGYLSRGRGRTRRGAAEGDGARAVKHNTW
ncbi:unnamed protein product [Ectocarpus sp. 12 AP-2014]